MTSAGLKIVSNVAIATGPSCLGTSRSSAINLVYYIIYKLLFNLRYQYFAKFALSVSKDFQLKAVCVKKFLFDSFFVQLRDKRHKIAVSSVAILADLLLNLAGISAC